MPAPTESRYAYRAFGVTIGADLPIACLDSVAADARLPAELTFHHAPARVAECAAADTGPGWAAIVRGPDGDVRLEVRRAEGTELLRFPGIADFAVTGDVVAWSEVPGASSTDVEALMLSAVVGVWLERRGRPVLHASGVVIDGRACLFLAESGGGKSGLASWLARDGCPLLGDDVIAVEPAGAEWLAQPSFPVVRMWPDLGLALGLSVGALPRRGGGRQKFLVPIGEGGWGRFAGGAVPLGAIVVASRKSPSGAEVPVRMERLTPGEAFAEAIRHSYVGRLAGAIGLDRDRFDRLAGLAARVPWYRLEYPSGFDRLPAVADSIRRAAARRAPERG